MVIKALVRSHMSASRPSQRGSNLNGLTTSGYRQSMRLVIVALGVLVALAGLLFALQGFGAVTGSPMTNTTTWSVLGPVIALIGVGIAFVGWRGRKP